MDAIKDYEQDQKEAIKDNIKSTNNPIITSLFKSIVNLITHFCRNTESDNQLFSIVADNLNENSREEALFNSLVSQDEEVRLSVVKCLFVVPLEQLDSEEIEKIVEVIDKCTNISEGKTELVLSVLFWIFYKLTHIIEETDDNMH